MTTKIRKRRANYFDGGGFSWQKGAGLGKNMANAFNSGALSGAIGAASSMIGKGISGGLSSGVGNAMQGLSGIASAIPGPWGAVASAGLNVVGGLVNRAFGSQIDEQAVADIREDAKQLSNRQFDASNTADLLTNANYDLLGKVNTSDIGKDGWFSNKAGNLAKELTALNMYANNNVAANYAGSVEKVDTMNDFNALKNQTAFGGPLMMKYTGTMSPFGNRFDTGGNIYIKPSKRGTFTAAAKKHDKSVQAFASQVLANKDNYSPAMVKKANFARNSAKWHATGGPLEAFINSINSRSKANFVQRLKDPNRVFIKDWGSNNKATHKLSWATDKDGNAIVFPVVQEINGKLYDFSDPKNKRGKWDAYDSAVERGDTLMMTPKQADIFTRTYKNYYPNFKANGGPLYTQGGTWDTGMTYINEGGTHEENPYEGVQVGVDPNGIPNTVEEGEVIFNDYVFSNRLKLNKGQKEYFKLGKNKEYSYADAAKKLTKEFEETPNDPISKNGRNAILQDLMMFQEEKRAKQQERKLARQFDNMSTEEKMGLMEMANQYAQQQNQEMQQPQEELQGIPYAKGGRLVNKFVTGGIEENATTPDQKNPYAAHQTATKPTNPVILQGWDSFRDMYGTPLYNNGTHDPRYISSEFKTFVRDNWDTYGKNWWTPKNAPDYFRNNEEVPSLDQLLVGGGGKKPLMYDEIRGDAYSFGNYMFNKWLESQNNGAPRGLYDNIEAVKPNASDIYSFIPKDNGIQVPYRPDGPSAPIKGTKKDKEIPTYSTAGMNAPLVGYAASIANNLFSKPDYSTADDLYSKAVKLGNINRVTAAPVSQHLRYIPTDVNRMVSQLNANTAATRRSTAEMSLNNRAQAMRQLSAINNNYIAGLSDIYTKSELENKNQLEKVATFNRDTDKVNSENALRAAMANQSSQLQGNVAAFSGIEKAIAERNRIDSERSAALSAGWTGYFQTLHDIAKQNFIMNSINRNPGYRYYYDRDGSMDYKGQNR